MIEAIIDAIEAICDDIQNAADSKSNKERAEAILTLALAGIFLPEPEKENEEDKR